MEIGEPREARQVRSCLSEKLSSINGSHVTRSGMVSVIAKSNRFYDSLMFSFALDRVIEQMDVKVNLIFVRGMFYRSFNSYLGHAKITDIQVVEAETLKNIIDNSGCATWIQCLRLPVNIWRAEYRLRLERFIREHIDNRAPARVPGTFTLLISFELEKRRWLQQKDGFLLLIKTLYQRYSDLIVLVNGLTSPMEGALPPSFEPLAAEEREMVSALSKDLGGVVKFINLYGLNLAEKISFIKETDFFFAPIGSAAIVPAYLGIPGVIYGTRQFVDDNMWLYEALDDVLCFDADRVKLVREDMSVMRYDWAQFDASGRSYNVTPEEIISFTLRHHRYHWLVESMLALEVLAAVPGACTTSSLDKIPAVNVGKPSRLLNASRDNRNC